MFKWILNMFLEYSSIYSKLTKKTMAVSEDIIRKFRYVVDILN